MVIVESAREDLHTSFASDWGDSLKRERRRSAIKAIRRAFDAMTYISILFSSRPERGLFLFKRSTGSID